ncbi:Hypothetical_protein [Hexamita inflata]|uniref:Hypothetical_protein n=1 Tax=Hexamita inflata TaxID=28002 RepID=A0ABP1I9N6_9EUKA
MLFLESKTIKWLYSIYNLENIISLKTNKLEVNQKPFTQFTDFQNERVQGTRKTMMDMLGHVIDSQIKAIRAENQTQHQATPSGSQKEVPTQQEVSLYNFDSFMQY